MQIVFKKEVLALTESYELKRAEMNGIVKDIIVHFPPGCSSLVDVRVFMGTTQVLPRIGYIALDDATPTFGIQESIKSGDTIRVEWVNTDSTYPHTISVIVNIINE